MGVLHRKSPALFMGTKLDLELERLFAAFRGTLKVIFCVANKYEISAKKFELLSVGVGEKIKL